MRIISITTNNQKIVVKLKSPTLLFLQTPITTETERIHALVRERVVAEIGGFTISLFAINKRIFTDLIMAIKEFLTKGNKIGFNVLSGEKK